MYLVDPSVWAGQLIDGLTALSSPTSVWTVDVCFPQYLGIQVDLLRMNSQGRCDPTAPTCDTKIKTEAKPATVGKIGEQSTEWQVDHQSTRETDSRTQTGRGTSWTRRDNEGDNLIPGNHDWPIPALSVQPSHLSRRYSHFSRLSATRPIPAPSLLKPIPVPVSSQFGLELGPEVGSCSC